MKQGTSEAYPQGFIKLFESKKAFLELPLLTIDHLNFKYVLPQQLSYKMMRGIIQDNQDGAAYSTPFIAFCVKKTYLQSELPTEFQVYFLYQDKNEEFLIYDSSRKSPIRDGCLDYCKKLINKEPCSDPFTGQTNFNEFNSAEVELIDPADLKAEKRRRCNIC